MWLQTDGVTDLVTQPNQQVNAVGMPTERGLRKTLEHIVTAKELGTVGEQLTSVVLSDRMADGSGAMSLNPMAALPSIPR